jgi:preprotein translocase subunit YajC
MNFYGLLIVTLAALLAFPEGLLAQETAGNVANGGVVESGAAAATPAGTATGGGFQDMWIMFLMPLALVVFMMLVMRPQQKEQKQREQMLKELKKNDRVVTVGGVVAKIANIQPDSKTVKLMLDEKSGSCMTVTLSSIAKVVTGDDKVDAGTETT